MLPEEQAESSRYLYELASGRFGWDEAILGRVQALHLKLGQGAKTGTGGHLPGSKVVGRIAEVRGLPEGTPAVSPARFTDWTTLLDARALVDHVRERSGGIPVGVKMSAQHVEEDLDAALDLGVDYVILDGRGAAPEPRRRSSGTPSACRRWPPSPGPAATSTSPGPTGDPHRDWWSAPATGGHRQGAGARRRRRRRLQCRPSGDRLRGDAGVPHGQLPGRHRHPEAAPAVPAAGAAGRRAADPLPRRDHRAHGRPRPGLRPRLAQPLHPTGPHELETRCRRPRRRALCRSRDDVAPGRRHTGRGPGAHCGRRRSGPSR